MIDLRRTPTDDKDDIRPFRGIQVRMSITYLLVITMTIGLFALSVIPYLKELLVERLEKTGEVVATSIAQVTVTSIVVEDYSTVIDHCVRVVKDRPTVLYIVITRKDGFSLVSRESGWRASTLEDDWLPVRGGGRFTENEFAPAQVYQYSHHLEYSGIDWGWIHIGLSVQSFEADLESVYLRVALIASLCILLAWITSSFLGRRLTAPLLELSRATKRIAGGDFRARANVQTGDEVESLARSLNLMAEELVKSRDTLEDQVNARTAELRAANQKLLSEIGVRLRAEEAREAAEQELATQQALSMRSDRLRSLGEMAAGIAHELSQPLVAVRGVAEHLIISIEEGWDQSSERLKPRLQRIIDQADRMVHIIEHVRMFAREAGKPELKVVDVNDVARSGVDMLGAQFRSHGLEFEVELEEDLPPVSVNPYSLEEVVLNLLNNARDALELRDPDAAGLPTVWVRTAVQGTGSDRRVVLEVRDNGPGIPPAVLEKVWDPFFTTKDPDKGTGLGLSISRAIIETFEGSLIIDSDEGAGATAVISLPIATESENFKIEAPVSTLEAD